MSLAFPDVTEPSTDVLPADVLKAIESRADVDSLGDLHARRRQLLQQIAPLIADYGPFGLWDAKRKRLLEALKIKARAALTEGGAKTTEAAIDATAHADEQYERFLDDSYKGKIDYINGDCELAEITERIASRLTELNVYNGELRLAR